MCYHKIDVYFDKYYYVNVFILFDKVLKKHGLMEYMDESFIRNTSRELITALQVSPDELNAAADALLKQEIQVKMIKYLDNFVMLIHKIFNMHLVLLYVILYFRLLEFEYSCTEISSWATSKYS